MKEFFRIKLVGAGGDGGAGDWTLVDVFDPVLYSKKR